MGFKCLTCCDLDFLAGGILCVALNLILRCKFSQNLPTNDSLQKDQLKLLQPENCILPGFFKILPPRRHSLGQRDLKGCGILSFSLSLYIYIYIGNNQCKCPSVLHDSQLFSLSPILLVFLYLVMLIQCHLPMSVCLLCFT